MSKAVLLVYTNCPSEREEEFNQWYDNVHVPDILGVEGVVGARRFKLSGPGPQTITRDGQPAVARYLAMYELDTDDTRSVMKRINETHAQLVQRGRVIDCLQVVSAGTYVALGEQT